MTYWMFVYLTHQSSETIILCLRSQLHEIMVVLSHVVGSLVSHPVITHPKLQPFKSHDSQHFTCCWPAVLEWPNAHPEIVENNMKVPAIPADTLYTTVGL